MRDSSESPVYVIVLNWNGWADTVACLESVLENDYPKLKIIVCDNASSDGSLQRIELWARSRLPTPLATATLDFGASPTPSRPEEIEAGLAQLILIQNGSNLGYAGGNNVGWRYAMRTDPTAYVLILNNDATIPPTFVSSAMAALKRHQGEQVAVMGFPAYDVTDRSVVQHLHSRDVFARGPVAVTRLANAVGDVLHAEMVGGYGILVAPYSKVKLFCEDYFLYLEDADFCQRVRQAGQVIGVQIDNPVYHKLSASVGLGSPLQVYYSRKSKLDYMRKFKTPGEYWISLARMTFSSATGILNALARRRFWMALAYFRAIVDHLARQSGRTWTYARREAL